MGRIEAEEGPAQQRGSWFRRKSAILLFVAAAAAFVTTLAIILTNNEDDEEGSSIASSGVTSSSESSRLTSLAPTSAPLLPNILPSISEEQPSQNPVPVLPDAVAEVAASPPPTSFETRDFSSSSLSMMILSPYPGSDILDDEDVEMWQNITALYLEEESGCPLQVSLLNQSFLPAILVRGLLAENLQQQSLQIDFQVEWLDITNCWNSTDTFSNETVFPSDAADLLLTVLFVNATEDYLLALRMGNSTFESTEEVEIVSLEDQTSTIPSHEGTAMPSMRPSLQTESPSAASPPPSQLDAVVTQMGSFEILQIAPHDSEAFTQGLELVPDSDPLEFFESTGLYGRSSLRRVEVATGQVVQLQPVGEEYFAEGLTYYLDVDGNPKLIQLTWKAGVVLIYDAESLVLLEERTAAATTSGEGWGICHVASKDIFYVTDGTEYLHMWDVESLELIDKVQVTQRLSPKDLSEPQHNLNEIEYDHHSDTILSNVWYQDSIVRIDPQTGFILQRYDLTSLANLHARAGVLNGIAVTPSQDEMWVTGKNWPSMYLIRLRNE